MHYIISTTIVLPNIKPGDSGTYICNGTDVLTLEGFSEAAEVWVSNATIIAGISIIHYM